MRLKYITLCLLGLSITGCAQHVIKTNSTDQSLGQQATQGLNAMFENASYDMKGQFSIQTDLQFDEKKPETKSKPAISTQPELDPKLKKQLDQLIKTQNIPFSQKEKKQLYQAIANESIPPSARYSDEEDGVSPQSKIAQSLLNVLNDLQFSYSGSVHFREKLAALTLQLSYQKPTLQVNAQLPMIIDFNQHKFYTNYFAFMPFMVNRESQSSLAYVDFSKHKETIAQYDLKKFADYLKQMNALPYVLAEPNQVQNIALTRDEKNAGLTKKIRYVGDLDALYTQLELFDFVNANYYTTQIKGQRNSDAEQDESVDAAAHLSASEEAMAAAEAAGGTAVAAAAEDEDYDAAYASVERVNELLNAKMHGLMYHQHETEDEQTSSAAESAEYAIDTASAYAEATAGDDEEAYSTDTEVTEAYAASEEDDETANLSEEVCQALMNTKQVPIGKVTLCQDYQDVRVIPLQEDAVPSASDADTSNTDSEISDAVEQLKLVFQQYQSEQLVDVKQFQQLWQKHQAEIAQVLNTQDKSSSNVVMDVGLDHKGRVQVMDYQLAFNEPRLGQLKLKSSNQILNYGNATPINRQAMKQAKSIEEVSKDSLFENMLKGLLAPITGNDPLLVEAETASVDDVRAANEEIELPEYLSTVALQSYKRHQSEVKAYQAAFVVAFANYRAQYVRYYSANDLNEIAEVYAYRFVDGLKEPTGNALKRLNQLRDKHALHRYQDFDDLGSSVNHYVQSGIGEYKAQVEWKQLQKTYKTDQAIFAHLYQQNFLASYELEGTEKAHLVKASKIYAQAFADDIKGKLSEASLQGLAAEHEELFSQSAYYETYKAIQKHKN
ncbi:hypothetical protein [Acinetobacter sp. YH12096]|uniref:hypothetical protein n=1 Tax=Acinetobacter sp. YH12096 TaxID=2601085 RepID=UPI0015D1F33A|nr:hypothetical protein [Acinetobacter sp. YH12096]